LDDSIRYKLEDAESLASILDGHHDYRILRRFKPDPTNYLKATPDDAAAEGLKLGVFADVEATGLNTRVDKILQLSMVPFQYNAEGEIVDVGKGIDYYEDPLVPIPPEITELTGITDAMVEGKRIEDEAVRELVAPAGIVIAHHASYDRQMMERRLPFFADVFWGCSWKDMEWEKKFGTRSSRLDVILSDTLRQFHDGHRALDDCHAAVNLLANARTEDGRTALSHLLQSARKNTARVWAVDSPYETKDALKARGYEWSNGDHGRPKCWYRDVRPSESPAEKEWLAQVCRVRDPVVRMFTAKDRYSTRVEFLPVRQLTDEGPYQ
jgi:DNA polymerase-3 subunit epsilon